MKTRAPSSKLVTRLGSCLSVMSLLSGPYIHVQSRPDHLLRLLQRGSRSPEPLQAVSACKRLKTRFKPRGRCESLCQRRTKSNQPCAKDGSDHGNAQRDLRLVVGFLGSRIVLLVSRKVGWLSQHVNDCRRDNYGDDDKSGDGCGVVVQASTSAFSSALPLTASVVASADLDLL